jgi:hypothetical protein
MLCPAEESLALRSKGSVNSRGSDPPGVSHLSAEGGGSGPALDLLSYDRMFACSAQYTGPTNCDCQTSAVVRLRRELDAQPGSGSKLAKCFSATGTK